MQPQSGNGRHRLDAGEHAGFAVQQEHECVVVMATGELDLQTAPGLRDAVKVAGEFSNKIIVDLTGVTLVDSTSLAVLVEAHNRALAADGALALVGLTGTVATAINITGLNNVFPTYAHVADAVAGLTEQHPGRPPRDR